MKLAILAFVFLAAALAQDNKPSVIVGQGAPPKKDKPGTTRPVHGVVKDADGNAVAQAVVRLKNLKTGKEIEQITRQDGTYRFEDLKLSEDYELQARYKGMTSVVKKLSMYDPRKDVVTNFDLESKTSSSK